MNLGPHTIAVCSWSLKPVDAAGLATLVKETGLADVQLALNPLIKLDAAGRKAYFDTLKSAGITVVSGMVGFPGEDYGSIAKIRETGGLMPDADWPTRKQIAIDGARVAVDAGVTSMTSHVGFVPAAGHPKYATARDRIGEVAREMAKLGVTFLFETGQEKAEELHHLLTDLNAPNIGANFDPANMILYGAGDPVSAVHKLGKHVRQVHVKDATASAQPGEQWGAEVVYGSGQVPHQAFADALKAIGFTGPLVIEREAGPQRVQDVKTAVEVLKKTVR
jgi:sugar phosphate isomerase/epimerase